MLRLEKGFKLYLSNDLLFDGEVHEADAALFLKNAHGHFKIRTRLSNVRKIDSDAVKLVSEDPITLRISSRTPNCLIVKLRGFKNENIYGGGEQFSRLNLKGKRFPIFVQEQGIGRGWNLASLIASFKGVRGDWYTSYFPQPVFFSSAGYGVVINTNKLVVADFRNKDETIFEVYDTECELIFLDGQLKDLVRRFHTLFGRPIEVSDWVFGVWIASQGGIEEAQKVIETCERWNIPLTALWCQDWCGKNLTKFGRQVYWNWSYDTKDYHDLPEYISKWKEKGVHFLGYINPFLIKGGPLYQEALRNDFLVKNEKNEPYDIVVTTFPAGLIDLTNRDAFEWYKKIIKENMIGIGMSGWMADYGEYLPTDARLKTADGLSYHSAYAVDWARLNCEAVEETNRDVIFFMRAGYLGSTKYSFAYWAGDQNVDWSKSDGLASVIPAMLSMGMCGVKLMHFDTGGFTSLLWLKRTPELFMRWTEIGAFSPIMRTHQTNRPFKNLQFDSHPDVLKHFARMSKIHWLLKDYLKQQLKKASEENLPLVKHLAMNYPSDPNCHRLIYQYLLGDDILIAPVIKPHAERWKVYLPEDKWVHLWTAKKFTGGWVEIDAPLGYPPVFLREDSSLAQDLLIKLRDVL
ncbi:MAG: Glycoside hydrolase family 31 [Thermotoga sp. 50_1627]|uniref:alpha-glucosidase n=1 Tax=Pseudothermotoga sp. TaxID=2033661 RepID=UPI00076D42BF|nr:MAG: Glycoside hydrolase family 31 [Thermotoga sp. 50_64]KUK24732.1 MAG: Glycoside hydrolase family 31 [Thermotoga sp. 50_1627]MBC7116505.1 alpha-glucosidase [Pseudothermotoga sp.]HBT40362.1 alpha-glucosidase [Pseudothermotoga sp.]HCO98957.1 alpha-glucosidase [Pseudothermotoga sp.]